MRLVFFLRVAVLCAFLPPLPSIFVTHVCLALHAAATGGTSETSRG